MSKEFIVHPSYLALIKQISETNPAGVYPCQHEDYEKITDELKKIGSLYHDKIQWHDVEKKSINLLKNECKDIVLFTGYILSQLNKQESSSLFLVLTMINGFIEIWRDKAHPSISTKKGQKQWGNRLNQIGRRLKQQVDKYYFSSTDKVHIGLCNTLLKTLNNSDDISGSELVSSVRYLSDKLKLLEESNSPSKNENTLKANIQNSSQKTNSTPVINKGYELSNKDLRTHCQDLIRHQNTINAHDPIIYRLRRYMLWRNIDSLPDANEEGKTELFAPPADLRNDYQQQLNKQIEVADWQRLEASLENSPYWITGHHLSYQYALKLNQSRIAQAIHEETHIFIEKFPEINNLSFADKGNKVPFSDKTCQNWLKQSETNKVGIPTDNNKEKNEDQLWVIDSSLPPSLSQAIQEALDEESLENALQLIDQHLQQKLEPRNHFYTQIVQAELYEKSSLHSLARQCYLQLWQQLQTNRTFLDSWEPQLVKHLELKINEYELITSELIYLPS